MLHELVRRIALTPLGTERELRTARTTCEDSPPDTRLAGIAIRRGYAGRRG